MSTLTIEGKEIEALSLDPKKMCCNIFESVKSGIYLADNTGNITFANQALVNMLGYNNKDEILGLNLAKELYIAPKDGGNLFNKNERKGIC